jgi:hypothetical protein
MKITKEQYLGLLRHSLTFAGGVAITLGWSDEAIISEALGLTMSLVGVIWSILTKK